MSIRTLRILITASLLVAMRSALAVVPDNPLLVGDSIYVSQQGIYKFDRNQREPLWSSLIDIETFELVVSKDLLLVQKQMVAALRSRS